MSVGEEASPARGLDNDRDWAVVVVHGIGTTEPVDLLERVARVIGGQRSELRLDVDCRVLHPDHSGGGDAALAPGILQKLRTVQREFFRPSRTSRTPPGPRHYKLGAVGQAKVTFATAHWSDIARVGESLGSVVAGLLLGGLGVRNFANVSTDSGRQPFAWALHLVLEFMIFLLGLVFLPLALASFVFSGAGLLSYYLIYGNLRWIQPWFTAVVSIGVSGVIAFFGIRYFWPRRRERSFGWRIFLLMLLFTVTISLLLLAGQLGIERGQEPLSGPLPRVIMGMLEIYGELTGNLEWIARVRLFDETAIYFGLMQLLQSLVAILVILLAVVVLLLLPAVWLTSDRRQFRGALLGAVSVVSMWVLLLVVLWPENLLTTAALSWYSVAPETRGQTPPSITYVFVLGTHFPWIWLEPHTPRQLGLTSLAYRLYPLLWHDLVFFAFLLLTVLVVAGLGVIRSVWCRLRGHIRTEPEISSFAPARGRGRPRLSTRPRLIVAGTYVTLVLVFMVMVCGIVLAQIPVLQDVLGARWLRDMPQELVVLTPTITVPVMAMLIGFVLLAHVIREAVKLVLDVVNHFAAPATGFPIRQQIAGRFGQAVDLAIGNSKQPHLVVIAHSQGTIIALDKLFGDANHPGMWQDGDLKTRVASLTVLTFGSPMTHIYQHYFGHVYRPFDKMPGYVQASTDPDRVLWINAYRIDDFIGTWIDNSLGRFPLNLPMPIGGHTSYWSTDVFERLFERPELDDVLATGRAGHGRQQRSAAGQPA